MKKIFPIGFILLCFFSNGFSQTITSTITITQSWVEAHAVGPWTISDGVTVTFGENLTLSSTTQYFSITTTNVTIDGANHKVFLNGITNFQGLVDASDYNTLSATIKNIRVEADNSTTLDQYAGYIARIANKATITSCFSTGLISSYGSGGIAGYYNKGNISNCYSTGAIGNYAGGIAGYYNKGNISNCYSTGAISGNFASGIVAYYNLGNISNCYTSGVISGNTSSGITFVNLGTISNCYTSGVISGEYSSGIVSDNQTNGTILDCRSSGKIIGYMSVGIATGTGTQLNASNVTPTVTNTWDYTIANTVLTGLTGLESVWNTAFSPYRLLSFIDLLTFAISGPITLCLDGSYYLNPSTTNGVFSSSVPSVAIVNSSGYITAVSSSGTTDISLTTVDGTITATVNVGTTSSVTISDPNIKPNYKFDNNPHGPIGGTINYIGYKGFNYSSQTRPTNTGYYRASKQDGNNAGCPVPFYIIKCDACVTVDPV